MWRFLLGLFRFGDDAFSASQSGDLDRMLHALHRPAKRVDRHFLLMAIVNEAYKKRESPHYAKLCARIATLHLSEFRQFVPGLKKLCDGELPRVRTFQQFATLLAERGEFDQAISVCEQALSFGLEDGTKAGFLGRIERIKKARAKAHG